MCILKVLYPTDTDDFEFVIEQFDFTPLSNTTMCVDITIVNDDVSETLEEFTITLSSNNALVAVNTPETQVLISDDDGKSCTYVCVCFCLFVCVCVCVCLFVCLCVCVHVHVHVLFIYQVLLAVHLVYMYMALYY